VDELKGPHNARTLEKNAKILYTIHMKTLYITDLDGTLLLPDETVSAYTKAAVNRFIKNGGLFTYATARSLVTASKVTAGLGFACPVICYNGTGIFDPVSGRRLRFHYLSAEEIAFARCVFAEHGVLPIVYAHIEGRERFSYVNKNIGRGLRFFLDSRIGDPRIRQLADEDGLYDGEIYYFSCIADGPELGSVHKLFRDDKRFACIYSKDIYSGAMWLELLPAAATKGNAALELKEMLGCGRMVAFGDGVNDMGLFKVADEAYAAANAVPELKALATAVIGANTDDGVARWLEENVV